MPTVFFRNPAEQIIVLHGFLFEKVEREILLKHTTKSKTLNPGPESQAVIEAFLSQERLVDLPTGLAGYEALSTLHSPRWKLDGRLFTEPAGEPIKHGERKSP